jgi:ElaB/YqjD/DUF883 family membrane-anchored ribosome-binding protein
MKRRAADNPVAVAAIGAGLAWRLWQKPPIATLLVGAGVAALFGRSSVREIDFDPYDPDRPSGYVPGGIAGYGYGTAVGTIEQKVIGGVTVAAETAREKASELRDRATELKDETLRSAAALKERALQSAGELRDNTVRSASELMDSARHSTDQLKGKAIRSSGQAVDALSSYADETRSRIGPAREYAEDMVRDNGIYLGLAALAVGAAAGIGFMQMNKPPPDDDACLEREDIRVE